MRVTIKEFITTALNDRAATKRRRARMNELRVHNADLPGASERLAIRRGKTRVPAHMGHLG